MCFLLMRTTALARLGKDRQQICVDQCCSCSSQIDAEMQMQRMGYVLWRALVVNEIKQEAISCTSCPRHGTLTTVL